MSQPLFRGTRFTDDEMRHAAAALEAAYDQIVRQQATVSRLEAEVGLVQAESDLERSGRLAAESQRDRAVEVLREVEWRGPRDMVPRCPCCECPGLPSGLTGPAGHAPDCRLDALLGEVGK